MYDPVSYGFSSPDMVWVIEFFAYICVGLIFGSFASALIARIPDNTIVFNLNARSSCPSCKHILSTRDLMPVLSWIITKGRCRYCQIKISAFYPLLEISAAFLSISIFLFFTPLIWAERLMFLVSVPFIMSLFIIDFRLKILPNILTLIIAGLGGMRIVLQIVHAPENSISIVGNYIGGAFLFAALSYILSLVMTKTLKRQAMGMGDVKFFAVAGLWLGVAQLSSFYILSGILGVLIGAIWQRIRGEAVFPFGPALIISFFILMFFV